MGCGVCADDHARIKLKVESSPSRSDYINASPIVSGSHLLPHIHPAPIDSISCSPRPWNCGPDIWHGNGSSEAPPDPGLLPLTRPLHNGVSYSGS